ncbi:major facilitator superfamily domain-containing protein, partial [Amylostereum chailletii]
MSDSEIKLYANSHTSQNSSAPLATHEADRPPRDWRFWCIILSLGIPLMLTAIEFTAVGTALPQIVNDLGRSQFVWVGSAYTLRSSAFLPFCGGLAQIFGQRTAMLGTLFLFGLGSVLCGASTSLNFLIAGRTVQGLGGGAIAALIQIVIADLVPLRDRGVFNGIMALAYAMGGGTGPIIGGSLAQHGNNWRWLFYLNLPICGLAAIMVVVFMRLKMPKAPLLVQFSCMDWIGNFLIVSSTMAIVIALTFGGLQFAWKMANVPLPLILGLLGLCAFLVYEILVAAHPIIPVRIIVTDRMTLSGYIQNFLNAMILATLSYWLPVYFQACKGASPMASGVDIFGISFTVSPFAVIAGGVVQKLAKYRPPIWFRWSLTIIGLALLTLVHS